MKGRSITNLAVWIVLVISVSCGRKTDIVSGWAQAGNPISPMGVYIADPTARVWDDGKIYVYGSRDESPEYYCSKKYHVLSASDMSLWTLHEDSFMYDETLYAPDAWYGNGQYHLYYDTPDGKEYVAVSDSPTGPFKGCVRISGPQQIDPNIFVDDDGQAYYFWGQFSAKCAKMNSDLMTLDWTTYKDGVVTEKDHYFHEGSFVFKRGDWYYFTYADISQKGRPTSIGYAMSKSPMGPYEYKGLIVDNAGCDPASWNNHGSVVQFKGNWYVFYHRSTHGCNTMRKVCAEPVSFNPDGTISQVEMTSQGVAGPLDAFKRIDAARACWMSGNIRIRRSEEDPMREELGAVHNGDCAAWKYIDFGKGADGLSACVKSGSGGQIVFKVDSQEGPVLGVLDIPAGADRAVYEIDINETAGVHALWIECNGPAVAEDNEELFSLDWIRMN